MTDTKQAQQMVNAALALYDAKIKAGQANPLNEIQPILLDLSTARTKENALKISFPFKSVRMSQASDLNTYIYLVPENNDQGRGATRLGLLDSIETEFGFTSCYVYWNAQAGKSALLEFYTTSKINNGRLLLDQNSVSTLRVGMQEAPDDGSTFIFETRINGNLGSTSDYMNVQGIYPSSNIISGNSGHDMIKIPAGYQGKIFGLKYEIYNAATFTGCTVALRNCSSEFNVAGTLIKTVYASIFQKSLGVFDHFFYDIFKVDNNIFDENTFVEPYIQPNAFTAGSIRFTYLLRLTKKVG